jgi:hypothetical protein
MVQNDLSVTPQYLCLTRLINSLSAANRINLIWRRNGLLPTDGSASMNLPPLTHVPPPAPACLVSSARSSSTRLQRILKSKSKPNPWNTLRNIEGGTSSTSFSDPSPGTTSFSDPTGVAEGQAIGKNCPKALIGMGIQDACKGVGGRGGGSADCNGLERAAEPAGADQLAFERAEDCQR